MLNIILVLPCVLIYLSLTKIPTYIKESKDFKYNYIKVEATIVSYETRCKVKYFNHKSRNEYSYSAICLYIDPNGNEYLLKTNTYLYSIPKVGTLKEIYINPNNPVKYYTSSSEISIPIFLLPVVTLLSTSYSYFTLKDFFGL